MSLRSTSRSPRSSSRSLGSLGTTIALAIALISLLGCIGTAAPTISVSSPLNGSTVVTHTVNVTGTAATTDSKWTQGDANAFNGGTKDGVVVNRTGYVVLDSKKWDNFDDNSWDSNNWTISNVRSADVYEKSGAMHIEGKSTSSSTWNCGLWVTSKFTVENEVQATLVSISGSGGFVSCIFMCQDSSNYAGIGTQKSSETGNVPVIVTSAHSSTVTHYDSHGTTNLNTHTYKVTYDGSKARLYQDDSLIDTITIALTNLKIMWTCGARNFGDTVDAEWDDVLSEFVSPGNLTSSVFDTKAEGPQLRGVDWTGLTPTSTQLKVELRSSNSSDMSSPTGWASVTNGQTSALPQAYRYLQYRLNLTTSSSWFTPALRTITLTYKVPLASIEVSIDKVIWTNATGLSNWYAILELPENSSYVWLRAMDMTGSVALASIRVEVDTTPPTGSVLVNRGDPVASDQDVTLSLSATDHYGVAEMMVDDSEDFPDGYWRPYRTTLSWHLPLGEGSKTVYAKFKDRNGWVSDTCSDSILLDTLPPMGTVVIEGGAEFTRGTRVSLSLSATDMTSVADMLIGEDPGLSGATWRPYSGEFQLELSRGDGEKRVYVAFRDGLGHVSEPVYDSINLDTTPPRLGITVAGGAPFTCRLDNQVELVALEQYRTKTVQLGESADLSDAPLRPFLPTMDWTFSGGDGTKALYARAWDAAGNVGTVAVDTILLDTVPPVVRILLNGGTAITNLRDVRVALEVTDSLRATTMWLGEDPGLAGAVAMLFSSPHIWTLSEGDGVKTLYASVIDAAGNRGQVASASITLDTTPPTLGVSVGPSSGYTAARSVTVELDALDANAVSGLQLGEDPTMALAEVRDFATRVQWLLSEGDGPKTVYARVIDEAGNAGAIASAATILDTTPPTFVFSIEGGSQYSNARQVAIRVEVADEIGIQSLMIGDTPSIAGMVLFSTTSPSFTLSGPDGLKTLYGTAIDRAGNVAPLASASIVLDTTPPVCAIKQAGQLPGSTRVHVIWSLSDEVSGPVAVDVQVRDGGGNWVDWLVGHGVLGGAAFEGIGGHNYSFRARAMDAAGNLGAYPEDAQDVVGVVMPPPALPSVTITSPPGGSTVKGTIYLSGTASHEDPARTVVGVKILSSGSVWTDANGATLWSVEIDTTQLVDGPVVVKVRAFDGQRYSEEASIDLVVDNRVVREPGFLSVGATIALVLLLVLIVIGAIAGYYLARTKGGV